MIGAEEVRLVIKYLIDILTEVLWFLSGTAKTPLLPQFFIIPVKAKWLGWLDGALLAANLPLPDLQYMSSELDPARLTPGELKWYREFSRLLLEILFRLTSQTDNALFDYALLSADPKHSAERNIEPTLYGLLIPSRYSEIGNFVPFLPSSFNEYFKSQSATASPNRSIDR